MIRNAWAQAKVLAGWEEAWLCVCVFVHLVRACTCSACQWYI